MLEADINRFLAEVQGELQLEEITQSEGPGGVTVTLWYSLTDSDAELAEELEGLRMPEMS